MFSISIQSVNAIDIRVSSGEMGYSANYNSQNGDTLGQSISLDPMASKIINSGSKIGHGDMASVSQGLYGPGSVHMYAAVKGNGMTSWRYSWYTEQTPGASVKASFTWNYVNNAKSIFAYADAWNVAEDQSYASMYAEAAGNTYANLRNYHVESEATKTTATAKQTASSITGAKVVLRNFGRNGDGVVDGTTSIDTGSVNAYSSTVNCDSASMSKRVDIQAASISAPAGKVDQVLLSQSSSGAYSKVQAYIEKGKLYAYPYRKSDYPAYALLNHIPGGGTFASQSEQMTGSYVRGSAYAYPGFGLEQDRTINSYSNKIKSIQIGNYARTGAIINGFDIRSVKL